MTYLYLILSVFIGSLVVVLFKPGDRITRLLVSFSGAYLLSVTILHLLPEVYAAVDVNTMRIGILILFGILIQSVLESFSKGAEHGHIHSHSNDTKFPVLLFVSLCLHSFSEGLPIHHDDDNLLWAIIIHKIPIAIVLTTFFVHSKLSKTTIFTFLSVFAFMSPLGVLVAGNFDFFSKYTTEISAFIIGVFLHISTIILFESSEHHKFNLQKFIAIILGISVTVVTLG